VGALRRRKGKGRGARRGINKRARTRRQFPAKFLLRDCVCGPQLRNPAIFTCRAVPLWHSSNQLSVLPLMSRPPFANVCAKQRRALLDKGSFWKLCEYAPSIRPAGFSSIAVCAAPLKPASFLQRYPPPSPPRNRMRNQKGRLQIEIRRGRAREISIKFLRPSSAPNVVLRQRLPLQIDRITSRQHPRTLAIHVFTDDPAPGSGETENCKTVAAELPQL